MITFPLLCLAVMEDSQPRRSHAPIQKQILPSKAHKSEVKQAPPPETEEERNALQTLLEDTFSLSKEDSKDIQEIENKIEGALKSLYTPGLPRQASQKALANILKAPFDPEDEKITQKLQASIHELHQQLKARMRPRADLLALKHRTEEQKETLYIHETVQKLKLKRQALSQQIEMETQKPSPDPFKLQAWTRELDGLDADALKTKTALAFLRYKIKSMSKEIQRKHDLKLQGDVINLKKGQQRAQKLLEHFVQDLDRKNGIQRTFISIKNRFSSEELRDLLTAPDSLIPQITYYKDKVILLKRLSALPPDVRKGLIKVAKQYIHPTTGPHDRIDILREFSEFKSAEEARQFSFEFNTELSHMDTSLLARNAARAWRANPQKFADNLRLTKTLISPKVYRNFIENFYRLEPHIQEAFLHLLREAPRKEREVLLIVSEINTDPFDPAIIPEKLKNPNEMVQWQKAKAEGITERIEKILQLNQHSPEQFQEEMRYLIPLNKPEGFDWTKAFAIKENLLQQKLIAPVMKELQEERQAEILEDLGPSLPFNEWDKEILSLKRIQDPSKRALAIRQAREEHRKILEQKAAEAFLQDRKPITQEQINHMVQKALKYAELLRPHSFVEEDKILSGLSTAESLEDDVFEETKTPAAPSAEKDSDYESGGETSPTPILQKKTRRRLPAVPHKQFPSYTQILHTEDV